MPSPQIARARRLRRAMTLPEIRLWVRLRAHAAGPAFRRQHPLRGYTLDFYCHAARLAIEVDGCAHSMGDNPARDEQRDASLRAAGLEVIRINASDIMADPDTIAEWLKLVATERTTPLSRASGGGAQRAEGVPGTILKTNRIIS